MSRFAQSAVLALALSPGAPGAAEIYKCLDGSGRPLYTSEKRDTVGKKCEVVSREVNVAPSLGAPKSGAKSAAPSPYPREDLAARTAAKERQRQILERELAAEGALLEKAKNTLAEQESVRQGDEKNYARVIERLKPYRDDIEVHEKNVAALKRELGNLYR